MVGALANLGHSVSDQTIGNVLKRHGIAPAPHRKHTTRWRDFIRAHIEVLAGITPYPDQEWMEQQARTVTMNDWNFLGRSRYLLHDRDGKFCREFRQVIQAGKDKPL